MEPHLTVAGCHLSDVITQCNLPPDTSEHAPLTPARQAGIRHIYPWGMESWVDQGDQLHTEMVYPPTDGHPSKY